MSSRSDLTRRVSQLSVVGLVVIGAAAAIVVARTADRAIRRRADEALLETARRTSLVVQRVLAERRHELGLIARIPGVERAAAQASAAHARLSPGRLSDAELELRLGESPLPANPELATTLVRIASQSMLGDLAVVDRYGVVIGTAASSGRKLARQARWWEQALLDGSAQASPTVDSLSGAATVDLAAAIVPPGASEPAGVVHGVLPLEKLGFILMEDSSLADNVSLELVDENRRVVFSNTNPFRVGKPMQPDSLLVDAALRPIREIAGPKGAERVAMAAMSNPAWFVVLRQPVAGAGSLRDGIDREGLQELLLLLALGILTLVGLRAWLKRRVIAPIQAIEGVATQVAHGNLATPDIALPAAHDEVGRLGRAIQAMVGALQQLARSISGGAHEVAASAQQISSATQEMSASTQQVATTTTELTSRASTQADQVRAAADDAQKILAIAAELANGAVEAAHRNARLARMAREHLERLDGSTAELLRLTEELEQGAREAEELAESSTRIENFVAQTRAIAKQTHMLALNAAIEAARGDGGGRGFGVVAEEVRKLAGQTSTAASATTDTVQGVLSQVQLSRERLLRLAAGGRNAREAARSATEGLRVIVREAETTDEWTRRISASAAEVRQTVDDIAARMRELATGTDEYAAMAEQIAAAAQQLNAATEQIAGSAQQLAAAAVELTGSVRGFQIEQPPAPPATPRDEPAQDPPYAQP